MGWLNNDVKTEDFFCKGATINQFSNLRTEKTKTKLSFYFETIFEFFVIKRLTKNSFKDFKIVVV